MNLRKGLATLVALLFVTLTQAQTGSIFGRLRDAETLQNLRGASVGVQSIRDSNYFVTTNTDTLGRFHFEGLRADSFRITYSYVGYARMQQTLRLDSGATRDLDDVALPRATSELTGVVIQGTVAPATQKGDTVQFNASSYKVNPDATSEDLVRKLPGITIENGQVKSNGENVQKVTIDGRELFGDDATAALRNLPAEIIDKIQVFDRLSDQAQLTGFDDGNSQRGINIVTKANMRNGQFGRIYAGAGTDEKASELRYNAGGNTTFLKENRRISLVGNFNNINQQNFAQQDLLGVTTQGSRGGGGGPRGAQGGGNRGQGGNANRGGGNFGGFGSNANFLVGQQQGINRTTAAGVNFSDIWGKKKNLTVTGSYFFNNSRNNTFETSAIDYYSTGRNSINNTFDTTMSTSDNSNHRINGRIEWRIDSSNQLIITPSLSFQNNQSDRSTDRFFSYNTDNSDLSQRVTSNVNNSKRIGNNLNNSILFRHSFAKRGRTFSVNLTTSSNKRSGATYVTTADRSLLSSGTSVDTTDRTFTNQNNDGWQVSSNFIYTEPVGTKGQLQLNYNPVVSRSNSDQLVYAYDTTAKDYTLPLSARSNTFRNKTDAQNGGLSYRMGDRDKMLSFGANYQHTRLRSDQTFPQPLAIDNSFDNILPNAMLRWKFNAKHSARLFYRANVNTPSVTQLAGVVDQTNPPLYTVGNPELDPQYTHTVSGQYTFTNTPKGQLLVGNVFYQAANKYISNATFQPRSDTVVSGVPIKAGSQLTKPVNLNGYQNIRALVNYAVPVKAIKSNLNFNTGITFSKLPGVLNSAELLTRNTVYTLGTVLASNISQYVDFTVSYSANFNQTRSSSPDAVVSSKLTNANFFQHLASVQLNLLTKNGWVMQTDANNQYFSEYLGSPAQNFTLWNLSVGKKFLKDRKGDLRLAVFDLLGQNQSVQRNVTDVYIENTTTQVLQRYFMLTFTYNLRTFGTAATRAANRGNARQGSEGQ
jgi:hypothetical protein